MTLCIELMFKKYHHLLSKSPIGSVPCCLPETSLLMKYAHPPSTHKRVIDVGAGQGGHTKNLRTAGYEVTPIDLDNSQFADSVIADMHEIPFPDNSFDQILCTGSFEHAFAPFIVLSEFKRILRNGGRILMNMPAENNIRMLEDAGHYCSLSRLQLEHMFLKKLDLKLVAYERGIWNDPNTYGEHQIFIIDKASQ